MAEEYYRTLGLMSGTSLDGLDLCHAHFHRKQGQWQYKIISTATYSYPEYWKTRLEFDPNLKAPALLELDHQYGSWLGEQVLSFLQQNKIGTGDIDFVASHGHTLYHRPDKGFTLQLGNGPELAAVTGLKCICDFRRQDVALGGQGAPLVPIGDTLLFGQYDSCLNIGGFANISFENEGGRTAFDICPVNFVLNRLAQRLGKDYDFNGEIAASAGVDSGLFSALEALSFYDRQPPKSLGAEWVNEHIDPLIRQCTAGTAEIIRSVTEHAAHQIARVLNHYNLKSCLLTGGGVYNRFLIDQIQKHTHCLLKIPESQLIEFKEALIFAFMGVLKAREENNILSSVTGSRYDHSAGIIYFTSNTTKQN